MVQLDQVIARSLAVLLLGKWLILKCSKCFCMLFIWPLQCHVATKQHNTILHVPNNYWINVCC